MADQTPNTPEEKTAAVEHERLPFDRHVFEASKTFADQLMREVPELMCLAIVPVWKVRQEHLPYGLAKFEKGQPESIKEAIWLVEAMHGMIMNYEATIRQMLQKYDQMSGDFAEELKVKHAQLQDLNNQIAEADKTLDEASPPKETS